MKTIAFNRSRSSMFSVLMVVGSLAGLYFYRSRGGNISGLFSGLFNRTMNSIGAESKTGAHQAVHGRETRSRANRSYQMDSVNLDTNPAI